MKRFFAILLSAAMLISASLFVSCGDNGSQETGEGGDNYYQWEEGDGSSDENTSGGEENDEKYSIPSTPQNVTTKATGSSSIEVSWDAVDDADSYVVYYRQSLGVDNDTFQRNGTEIAKTTTDTSVSIYGLTEWEIYLFWVTAKNSAGESRESDIELNYPCSATDPDENGSESGNSGTTTTTISAPTGLTATAASSSSIKLSWNSVSDATGYQVYCSEYSYTSSASLLDSMTSTSTTATGLKANTKYYFWIKATNSTTTSDYSSYAYATTKVASSGMGESGGGSINEYPVDLVAPAILVGGSNSLGYFFTSDGKGVKITFIKDSSYVDSRTQKYRLYRSQSQYDGYELVKEVSSSGFSYVIEDRTVLLQEGTYFYYRVAAACGNSEKRSINGIELYIGPPKISVYAKNTGGTRLHFNYEISFDNKQTYYPINLKSVDSVNLSDPPTSGTYSYSIRRVGYDWKDYSTYTFEPLYAYNINAVGGTIKKEFKSKRGSMKVFVF